MIRLTETILQFGAGNFLRGFADLFVHQANESGQDVGRIVVVQATGSHRAALLNERAGRYHVAIRGIQDGQIIDRVEPCESISRALVAATQWPDVLQLARSPDLRYVISNTTETGYELSDGDDPDAIPPTAFPAKLLAVLYARWRAELPPLTVLPCELIENNAVVLRERVITLAERWNFDAAFVTWANNECIWLCSLVDRIVPGRPEDHPLSASDPLLLLAEPFAFWALQANDQAWPWIAHPAILRTPDVMPYFLRKVRILNGMHTALLCHVGLDRFATVLEAVSDFDVTGWLERLVFDEIIPVVEDRCPDASGFARQTFERVRNPFLKHQLSDIALCHAAKKTIRLESTAAEYRKMFGSEPPLLREAIRNDRVPRA